MQLAVRGWVMIGMDDESEWGDGGDRDGVGGERGGCDAAGVEVVGDDGLGDEDDCGVGFLKKVF